MRRIPLRRAMQVVAVALLAGSGSTLLTPGAHAAGPVSTSTPVVQQAWFWQTAYEQANPPVAPPAVPPSEPSGVPDGDLAVAYTGNTDKSSSKLLALSFDISALTPGTSIQQFSFSLTLDTQPTATNFDTANAPIVACLPTRLWPAQMPGDYTNEPTVDCSKKVAPTVNGNTYTFKIPVIAQSWIDDQNLGVAVVADADTVATPFQLDFLSAAKTKAAMVYLPGAAAPPPPTGGTSTPPATTGSDSGPSAAPPPVAVPPTTTTNDTSAAPPVVASPQPVTAPVRTVAAAKRAPTAPTSGFWVGAAIVAVLLLLASFLLGDPNPPAPASARSRLDRVLRDRDALLHP